MDFAEDARINDFTHMLEAGFKAAVLPDKEFAGIFFVQFGKFFSFGAAGGDGFFNISAEPRFQSLTGMTDMVKRKSCHRHQIDIFVGKEFCRIAVKRHIEFFAEFFSASCVDIANGSDFQNILISFDFAQVHTAAGTTQTPDTNFYFFAHFQTPFVFRLDRKRAIPDRSAVKKWIFWF